MFRGKWQVADTYATRGSTFNRWRQ